MKLQVMENKSKNILSLQTYDPYSNEIAYFDLGYVPNNKSPLTSLQTQEINDVFTQLGISEIYKVTETTLQEFSGNRLVQELICFGDKSNSFGLIILRKPNTNGFDPFDWVVENLTIQNIKAAFYMSLIPSGSQNEPEKPTSIFTNVKTQGKNKVVTCTVCGKQTWVSSQQEYIARKNPNGYRHPGCAKFKSKDDREKQTKIQYLKQYPHSWKSRGFEVFSEWMEDTNNFLLWVEEQEKAQGKPFVKGSTRFRRKNFKEPFCPENLRMCSEI